MNRSPFGPSNPCADPACEMCRRCADPACEMCRRLPVFGPVRTVLDALPTNTGDDGRWGDALPTSAGTAYLAGYRDGAADALREAREAVRREAELARHAELADHARTVAVDDGWQLDGCDR